MSFDVAMELRGKSVTVRVTDQLIQGHQLDEDGDWLVDEIVFQYKVYDNEEDAEILQLSAEERLLCHAAILADIQGICDEQEGS